MTEAVQLATNDDLHAKCWVDGRFEPYLHAKQLEAWDLVWRWWQLDPTEQTQGQYARIFGLEWGRRVGKSAFCTWVLSRLAVLLPPLIGRPAKLRYTTMFQHSIDTIVGEVLRDVFRHAPASCQPQYHGKRGVQPAGLYFPVYGPMQGSYIAMAGLDKNPHALRGQGCDGEVISEAGFIDDLEEMIEGVLYAQYQGRDWARMLLETSAPDRLHTAWELKFLPDCKLRGAHHSATLDDNPRISKKAKAEFIRAAGGRGSVRCEREYYNKIAADATLKVFPELMPAHMLDEYTRPEHALAFTALDPGHRDLFAALFAIYDCARAALVIVDCWAESNASTEKVAAVVAAREFDLWGFWPSTEMQRIPLRDVVDESGRVVQLGWESLLAGDRCARHAETLYTLANKPTSERPEHSTPESQRRLRGYEGMLTHYDQAEQRFVFGPKRVSDVNPQLIHDLSTTYGIYCATTTKDDLKDTMVWNTRSKWLSRGRLLFTQRAQLAYDHLNACVWDERRSEFDHHPTYSHFDLAAASVYLTRYADLYANTNPEPPEHLGRGGPDWIGVPEWQQQTSDSLLSEMF